MEIPQTVFPPEVSVEAVESTLLKAGYIVVVDKKGVYQGILIPLDVVRFQHRLIADCLRRRPVIDAEANLEEALVQMQQHHLAVLAVFDQGEYAGVVRQIKVLEYLNEYHRELEQKVIERTSSLQEEIRQRKEMEEHLERSLADKNILLQELHHRVKNNLQVISSLIRLQGEFIDNELVSKTLKDTADRIRALGVVHEQFCRSKNLHRIEVEPYLTQITQELIRAWTNPHRTIHSIIQITCGAVNIDTAVPVGLLVNEMITNSLKHAFVNIPEPAIRIDLREEAERNYCLVYSDNGIGLPAHITFEEPVTLGFQLISALVQQLRGRIEIDRSTGTTYRVHFLSIEKEEKRWGKKQYS